MKMTKIKKSQAWSFDIILAVIIFVGAFFVFYALLKPQTEKNLDTLQEDANLISQEMLSGSSILNVIEDGKINEEKLQQLLDEEYSTIKSQIRIESDFCIYLEDQDGNVIYLGSGVPGVGSESIKIGDVPCS